MTAPLRLCVRRQSVGASEAAVRDVRISIRVPSAVDVIEEAVDLVARHCLAAGLAPRRARFHLRVALCEALANAIVYGNDEDPTKGVDVLVTVTSTDFTVQVQDEGPGFDPSRVPEPNFPDDIEATGGRGLYLIRQLMDAVYFNERGNAICMVLRRA